MNARVKKGLTYVGYLIAALITLVIVKVLAMSLFYDREKRRAPGFASSMVKQLNSLFAPMPGLVQEDRSYERFERQRTDPIPDGIPTTYRGDVVNGTVSSALRALRA